MSVLIKGLNIKPCKDGFGGKGLVIIGYDDKLYTVAHEQIVPLPDDATIEPKKGKWLDADSKVAFFYECSECGCYLRKNKGEVLFDFGTDYNYCPNCGARMSDECAD